MINKTLLKVQAIFLRFRSPMAMKKPMEETRSMDMVMIDVTDIPGIGTGDEVVLIGRQGQDEITAVDLAEWTGTIPYEILCSIGPRVPRLYQSL